MAKKVIVSKNVPANKVEALIAVLKEPPAATDIKSTKNADGTFTVEATVTV